MSNKARSFCFTWNNYSEGDIEHLKSQACKYLIAGKEKGESGTPHLQGFVTFENPRSFESIRTKFLLGKCHVEVSKSATASIKYCKKDGDWFETGIAPEQGRRHDLEDMVEKVKEGATNRELWQHNPTAMTLYHKSFERCRYDLMEDRDSPPKVFWYFGGTGSGKTRTAFEAHETRYIKDGTMWWDGYSQQQAIIIDDFDGRWPYRDLLRLLDRYPYSGQVKGGYVKINSPFIYITCEYPPNRFWDGSELEQVLRRITKVTHFNTPVEGALGMERNGSAQ